MNLEALRKKHAEALASMQAIMDKVATEARGLTDDEKAEFDKHESEANSLADSITRASRFSDAQAQANAVIPAASRSASLIHAPADPARREFESFGEFAHAVAFRPNDQRLNWQENLPNAEQRMDVGSAGGYMVPKQFVSTLMSSPTQGSIIRPRARKLIVDPASPDAAAVVPALNQGPSKNSRGGVEVRWANEGASAQDTGFELREIEVKPDEMTAIVPVTDKILRNWANCAAIIETLLRDGVVAKEEKAFLLGDGVGKPLGILKSPALKKINRATAGTITFADITEFLGVIKLSPNLEWQINQTLLPTLSRIKDDAGNLIWTENAREGSPGSLSGYPVMINEFAPQKGTLGDLGLYDCSSYLIKDGSGPLLSASTHSKFRENKTEFKIVWNTSGQPWLDDFLVREDGTTCSPFAALDVPII